MNYDAEENDLENENEELRKKLEQKEKEKKDLERNLRWERGNWYDTPLFGTYHPYHYNVSTPNNEEKTGHVAAENKVPGEYSDSDKVFGPTAITNGNNEVPIDSDLEFPVTAETPILSQPSHNIDIGDLTTNFGSLTTNIGKVTTNSSDVTNLGELTSNLGDVTTNLTDVTKNLDDVTSNLGELTSNIGDVTTNLSDVATNFNDVTNDLGDATTNLCITANSAAEMLNSADLASSSWPDIRIDDSTEDCCFLCDICSSCDD